MNRPVLYTGKETYWDWVRCRYLLFWYLVLAKMNPSADDWFSNSRNFVSCSPLVSEALNPDHTTRTFFLPDKKFPKAQSLIKYLLSLLFIPTFKFCFALLLKLQLLDCYFRLWLKMGNTGRIQWQRLAQCCFKLFFRAFQAFNSWTALTNSFNILILTMRNTQTHSVITQTSLPRKIS